MNHAYDRPAPQAAEITDAEPKELFCAHFDVGCFEVADPAGCKRGQSAVINAVYYYTLPVEAICPMCDRLK